MKENVVRDKEKQFTKGNLHESLFATNKTYRKCIWRITQVNRVYQVNRIKILDDTDLYEYCVWHGMHQRLKIIMFDWVKSLRLKQNGRLFADHILKCIWKYLHFE